MAHWKKLSQKDIRKRIFESLNKNINYYEANILGVPASHLDNKVYYQDAPFLSSAPYLSTLIHNPNHIGCHTLGKSESFFEGTQDIEKEVIKICAGEILKGSPDEFDGYIASGGTEANLQAIWVYRNYFRDEFNGKSSEICILCSEDSHYSISKAANIFDLDITTLPVGKDRKTTRKDLESALKTEQEAGKKFFIVIANMMTTMFGSVDDINLYTRVLDEFDVKYKVHVDGAFGGFFYPFSNEKNPLNFANPKVDSVTLDAHKMLQAPYGTGIFLIRKGLIAHTNTKEAKYVEGEDFTLIGSRSGANAVAVWMILSTYGPYGWHEKIMTLLQRTDWLCGGLQNKNIAFFREPASNIVAISANDVPPLLIKKYGLVPDNHDEPKWLKIVVMEHVTIEKLQPFVDEL